MRGSAAGVPAGARHREHLLLELLAKVAAGLHAPDGAEHEDELRQLGYGCYLARRRVEDPDDNLGRVALFCMQCLEGRPRPEDRRFRDPVQERWGAPWHMDIGKLRTELPVYLMRLRRETPGPEPGCRPESGPQAD